jgi:probable F420-dependent oxidoreductase
MEVGLTIPTRGPLATPDRIAALVRRAEELGFAHLSVSDHLVVPRSIESRYPYSESGAWPGAASGECLEQLTLLAYLAAISRKPRLITAVAVIPYRAAMHTAKIAATIDVLSQGRMILGAGAGWMKEEFEAVGSPPFEERGRVTDEYLQAFKTLWTEDDPRFAGDHVRFADISFLPKPVQKPHPPIWVGGESGPALRRTAQLGDAWYPIGTNPANPLDSLKRFKTQVERLRKMTAEAGRKPDAVGLTLRVTQFGENAPAKAGDGERRLFSGKPAELAADIKALAEIGVGCLDFGFAGSTVDAMLAEMQKFKRDVLALA